MRSEVDAVPRLAGSGHQLQDRRARVVGGARGSPTAIRGRVRPQDVPCPGARTSARWGSDSSVASWRGRNAVDVSCSVPARPRRHRARGGRGVARLRARLAVRLAGALPRRVGDAGADRRAHRAHRTRSRGSDPQPSPRARAGDGDCDPRKPRARPDCRGPGHRLHRSHGPRPAAVAVGGGRGVPAPAARPAPRRAGRGGRVRRAHDPAGRFPAGAAGRRPDPRGCQRAERAAGGKGARRRCHDHRLRPARVRLVRRARVRDRARRGRAADVAPGARGRRPRTHRRVPRDVRGEPGRGRLAAGRTRVAGDAREPPRERPPSHRARGPPRARHRTRRAAPRRAHPRRVHLDGIVTPAAGAARRARGRRRDRGPLRADGPGRPRELAAFAAMAGPYDVRSTG